MPEEAVLEPLAADTSSPADSSPIDTSVADSGTPDAGEQTTSEGEAAPQEGQQFEEDKLTSQKPAIEGKNLDPKVKGYLDELRKTDPVTAARIRNTLMQGEALRAEVPGGVKEIRALKQFSESVGGEEGLREIQTGAQNLQDLDRAYDSADPKFLDELINANSDSFLKFAPQIADKYLQMDPDGATAYIYRIINTDAFQRELPFHMKMLGTFIDPNNANAVDAFKNIEGYFANVKAFAQKPINTVTKKEAATPDARETELTQRETQLASREYEGWEAQTNAKLFDENMALVAGDRKVSSTQRAEIQEIFRAKLRLGLKSVPRFAETRAKYFASRDMKGFQRYMGSIMEKQVPTAAKYAAERILGPAKPRTAPAQQNGSANGAPKPSVKTSAPAGFEWTGKPPEPNQIDMARTNTDMIKNHKAVLRSGKRVFWP